MSALVEDGGGAEEGVDSSFEEEVGLGEGVASSVVVSSGAIVSVVEEEEDVVERGRSTAEAAGDCVVRIDAPTSDGIVDGARVETTSTPGGSSSFVLTSSETFFSALVPLSIQTGSFPLPWGGPSKLMSTSSSSSSSSVSSIARTARASSASRRSSSRR